MTIAAQPPTSSPWPVFPFFRVANEQIDVEAGPRVAIPPWALVALPDAAASREVTLGLESSDFQVRRAKSGADVYRVVSEIVLDESSRLPALIVVSATLADGPAIDVIRSFAALGWHVPILVCLNRPAQAFAFCDLDVHTLCAAAPHVIVGTAIRLSTRGRVAAIPLFH